MFTLIGLLLCSSSSSVPLHVKLNQKYQLHSAHVAALQWIIYESKELAKNTDIIYECLLP